ncbi:MAG TPA: DUF1501 domain-containing protein [Pirellulales bacterium]|nr:DUF1501 domain-containing protein [Pirellulales bacterium]
MKSAAVCRLACSRRAFLQAGSALGLSLRGLLQLQEASAATLPRSRARSVIILYLSGGPSQLDMWDLKPQAPVEIRGTFQPIETNVPGIRVSEHLPRTARLADKFAIIRSMSHQEGDHLKAGYLAMTGGPMTRPVIQASGMQRGDRPHVGAVISREPAAAAVAMPPFVMVPEFISPVGVPRPGQHGGFLGPAYDPYLIDSDPNLPEYSPGALAPMADVAQQRLQQRRSLLAGFGRVAPTATDTAEYDRYLLRALDLVASTPAQRAFDLQHEPDVVRDRYGRHVFGQSALVARRLIEADVRLVQVNFVRHDRGKGGQGYDSHSVPPSPPHLAWAKSELLPPTDAAFAALIEDLSERGLLDETLVIMLGEFGRTPRFNAYGGRDHWPQCYSAVVAGGGVRGGNVYGESDKIAAFPRSNPVSPEDLLATMYYLLGIDSQSIIEDQQGRPLKLADGHVVTGLL